MREAYELVKGERRPAVLTVIGDAGVGKSRVIQEFLAGIAASSDHANQLHGRCLPQGQAIVYWPLAEVLRECAGVLIDDPAQAEPSVSKGGTFIKIGLAGGRIA